MSISDLTRILFFMKRDLIITRISAHHVAIKHDRALVYYRNEKLIENYFSILNENKVLYYPNLYK